MVRRERMVVDSKDWKTLLYAAEPSFYMRGSINGEDSVRLFLNGVEIPKHHAQFGWSTIPDPTTAQEENLTDRRRRMRLNNPLRMTGLLEMDYRTIPAHCQKCNGYGKTNDFYRSPKGSFGHIIDQDKLLQRVLKFLLTSQCAFYPTLVSSIKDSVSKKLGFSMTEEDIMSEISASLNNLMRIQTGQKAVQTLSPQEILKGIEDIWTAESQIDPTRISVSIQVSSYGKEQPAPLSFTMRTSR
jgi:hypothetical protein